MKRLFFIVTLYIPLLSCCKKEEILIQYDERGAITSMPWLWRVSITKNDYNNGYVTYPVSYNSGVLFGAENSEDINYLNFYNSETGDIVWSQDYIYPATFFNIFSPYVHGEDIITREGHNLFSIDLKSGNYNWKTRDEAWGNDWLSGIDSLFFNINSVTDPETGYPVASAFVGSTLTGEQELFLIPDLGDLPEPDLGRVNFALGGFRYVKPFHNDSSGDIMLLGYYDKQYYLPNSDDQISHSYMGLYNFSEKKWVYERIELGERNFLEGFTPTIIGDQVYHTLSSGVAECRNLYTGDLIWRNENDYQYSGTSFIIVGNKMIVMDDWNNDLIAYGLSNGQEAWHIKSSGNIGYMQELNGIVYFYSGADGRIHAVEAETGKYIWHLISPDEKDDIYDYFMEKCTVIPGKDSEKGRVVVSSFTHAYCFEAAR
jgi:outer membrane protein assembly factor BamB